MKKIYEIPTVEMIVFNSEDIITLSGVSLLDEDAMDELEYSSLK